MEEIIFLEVMTTLVVLAGICSILFNKLKLPAILGYLLAGIIVRNVLTLDYEEDLEDVVKVLSYMGLVMLMFAIGMELDIGKVKKSGKIALLVSLIQLPLMVFIGYVVGMLLGFDMVKSIALGAIISGSSTAVVSAVLASQNRISKEDAETLLLVTVIEDIGQVLMLSLITPLFAGKGAEISELLILVAIIAVFLILCFTIGVKVVPRVVDWIGDNSSSEVTFIIATAFCFVLALLSKSIGMSMAIGAFMMGMMISQSKHIHKVEHKVEPLKELFMAVFFISVGMEVAIGDFISSFGLALIIFAVFMIAKFSTVFLGYYVGNKPYTIGFASAISLMAMGEFAFIIGKEYYMAFGDNQFYTAVIGAALMSMIVLPILSKYTFNIVDKVESKKDGSLYTFLARLDGFRKDLYARSTSIGLGDVIKKSLRTVYVNVLVLLVVQAVFIMITDPWYNAMSEYMNEYVAYGIIVLINLLFLLIPTYMVVTSGKKLNFMLIASDNDDNREMYRMFVKTSTVLSIFAIDFLLLLMLPNNRSMLATILMLGVVAVVVIASFIYVDRRAKHRLVIKVSRKTNAEFKEICGEKFNLHYMTLEELCARLEALPLDKKKRMIDVLVNEISEESLTDGQKEAIASYIAWCTFLDDVVTEEEYDSIKDSLTKLCGKEVPYWVITELLSRDDASKRVESDTRKVMEAVSPKARTNLILTGMLVFASDGRISVVEKNWISTIA